MSIYSQVLQDDPRGYWPLDEASGTSADDLTVNNHPGTYTGGFTLGATGPAGLRAVDFDGSTGYVNVPDEIMFRPGSGAWTIECWANPANADQLKILVGKRQNVSPFEQWSMWIGQGTTATSSKRLYVLFHESSSIRRGQYSDSNIADGLWHHLVGVSDGSAIRLHVDGVEVASTLTENNGAWPTVNNTDPIRLAESNGGGHFYGDALIHAAVYNTALSATRIQAHYLAGMRSGAVMG